MAGDAVSVIVPSYNHEKYIRNALASIVNQTYAEIELVLIDDCSTDNTLTIAKEYLEKTGDRFKNVIVQKNVCNSGAATAINTGLELANGQWLTILNSDDSYMPERFERLLAALAQTGRQHGFTNLMLIDADGTPFYGDRFAMAFLALPDRIAASPSVGFPILDENIAHTSGNLFFSRALYKQVGGFCQLKLAHDWDYLIRLLAQEEPVFVPEPLYAYRIHACNSYDKLQFSKYFDPLVIYRRYFRAVANGAYRNPLFPIYHKMQNAAYLTAFEEMVGKDAPDYDKLLKRLPQRCSQRNDRLPLKP